MNDFLTPQFTPLFVLIACLVFAWIGWMMKGDDGPPGGSNAL